MPARDSDPSRDLNADPLLAHVPVHEGYKVLGGVVLYEKIGAGGMGAVYRGRHLRLDVDVAVKVMAPPAGLTPEKGEDFIRRFVREARTAARIDHTNLVRVLDVNSEGGVYYLVMQLVDGESAAERLARKGRLSEGEAGRICLAAATALAEAHAEGIIHRDVKPDNIMIDRSGKVKVTDLGLAKAYSGESDGREPTKLTRTQAVLGTPYYMAPEQFASAADLGPAVDVWSLGVTLCELLTGERPWTDDNVYALVEKIRDDPPPDPRELSPDLSYGICRIIEKALRKNPQERYADCGQMADALREHVRALPRSRAKSSRPKGRSIRPVATSAPPPDPETMALIERVAVSSEAARRRAGRDAPTAPPVQEELFDNLPLAAHGEAIRKEKAEEVHRRAEGEERRRRLQQRERRAEDEAKGTDTLRDQADKLLAQVPIEDQYLYRDYRQEYGDETFVQQMLAQQAEDVEEADALDGTPKRGEKARCGEQLRQAEKQREIDQSQLGQGWMDSQGYEDWQGYEDLLVMADIAFQCGDFDLAIRDYDEAIGFAPEVPTSYVNRGLAKAKIGDLQGAIRDYDKAIELEPRHGHAYHSRGLTRKAMGDMRGAEQDFETARRLGYSGDE